MSERTRVAIVGGGCGGITAAFELTRPEHQGRFDVTVYQLGWRLGGKGASGRGVSDRIEEHGLHIWMGAYENAFRLMRECYAELGRPEDHPIPGWREAFTPDPYVAVADRSPRGEWLSWVARFPEMAGEPGDPLSERNPFTLVGYMRRTVVLIRTLLLAVQERAAAKRGGAAGGPVGAGTPRDGVVEPSLTQLFSDLSRLMRMGQLATLAALVEGASNLELVFRYYPGAPPELVQRFLGVFATNARTQIALLIEQDDEIRRIWEILDLTLAILRGMLRHGLLTDPRGLDAINDYECREWLRLNGASEASLDSAIMQGLYDLAFAYEDGDFDRPCLAAGQAIRGAFRMFFTYRGALFYKMNAGMGDIVFAPFYEVLRRRGVRFEFFHRLEDVHVDRSDPSAPYVSALDFDVQARVRDGAAYEPLVDVDGLPCWPARPDYAQLEDGESLQRDGVDLESFWDTRRAARRTLRVREDFDAVVLAVGLGAVPHVASELVRTDRRWRDMVEKVKTVATQAFQLWLSEDVEALGWQDVPVNLSGFVRPFDTWADMRQLIPVENWGPELRSIAYFCSALPTPPETPSRNDTAYPEAAHEEVRANAVRFLERHMATLWPGAYRTDQDGVRSFRWELLLDGAPQGGQASDAGPEAFRTQFWTANVNPSDRYVLCPPGSTQYRISPLDETYDNLTIAGDWTDCGFTEGCVEAAVMSGRLAAHALSRWPPLEDIVGFDHP
jgi:uncharacterized protein with NAD-binding domain and iron-sulfur cluster